MALFSSPVQYAYPGEKQYYNFIHWDSPQVARLLLVGAINMSKIWSSGKRTIKSNTPNAQ